MNENSYCFVRLLTPVDETPSGTSTDYSGTDKVCLPGKQFTMWRHTDIKSDKMQKVLVAGASGSLGFEVLSKLKQMDVPLRALVSSPESARKVESVTGEVVIADVRNSDELKEAFRDVDIVFSAVGQSVSLSDNSGSFEEIDFGINKNLIDGAVSAGVRRFIYVSIKGVDVATTYEMAIVHKRVEDYLKERKISYTIIRPVGFFSGFNDWIAMGKRGIIPLPGSGTHKTNPIHPEDLAAVVADVIHEGPEVMEAGGPEIYTRAEIARMISEKTNGKVTSLPGLLIEPGLIFMKIFDRNTQAKLDYFNFVSTHDMVAPQYGTRSLKDYIMNFDLNQLQDAWPI